MIGELFSTRTAIKLVDARDRHDSPVRALHSEYQWRKVRKAHIKDEGCCQMCGILKKLEVHHIEPWHVAPALRYERSNLITLCRECHYRFGHYLDWHGSNPHIRALCAEAQTIRALKEN